MHAGQAQFTAHLDPVTAPGGWQLDRNHHRITTSRDGQLLHDEVIDDSPLHNAICHAVPALLSGQSLPAPDLAPLRRNRTGLERHISAMQRPARPRFALQDRGQPQDRALHLLPVTPHGDAATFIFEQDRSVIERASFPERLRPATSPNASVSAKRCAEAKNRHRHSAQRAAGEPIRSSAMRPYVPVDDGQEPTGWEGYVDYPAKNDKELAARVDVYVERDPKKAAALGARQNAAILELLRWVADNEDELRARHPELWVKREEQGPQDQT